MSAPSPGAARLRATIRIHGLGRAAEAAAAALRPDDKGAPPWMRISEHVEDGNLVIVVEVDGLRLGSLRNTVDEILSTLYSLLKAIEETAKALNQTAAGPGDAGREGNEPPS